MALLSRAVLAKALWDKTTLQYKDKPIWGAYSYDRDIYPQARLAFPEYAKLYPTNEEFTKYFVRDLNHKNPKLLQKLTVGALTKEDQALIDQFNQTTAEEQITVESPPAEATPSGASTGTATAGTTGGMGMPGVPAASSTRRVYVVQQTPPPKGGMEGGTGQGTAATTKIDRLRTGATKATVSAPQEKIPSGTPLDQRLNLQGFKVPPSLANTAKNFGSSGQIFAKRNLGRVFDGLKGIGSGLGRGVLGPAAGGLYSVGGRLGNGALDAVGRISRPGGLGGGRMGGLPRSSNKWAFGLIGLMLFMVILGGVLGGIGGTTPGEAAPLTGSADISSCKFTRSAERPSEASFKSSTLISYINEAAQKANIPPVVLAAFIRVESASTSNMSNDEVANYSKNCAESPTGALGIMQIQPPGTKSLSGDPASCDDCIDAGAKLVGKTVDTLTRDDYCDPRTSIIVGAGWILKKMSKLGYGDGTKWDPAWTSDRKAIEALVNTYYGCIKYGSVDDTKTPCSDPGRIYSYADDVWTSIQNCKAASIPPPPADGNYRKWLADYDIDIKDGFPANVYKWAYEVLASAATSAPQFKNRLGTGVSVEPTCTVSITRGRVIYLRNNLQACPGSGKEGPTGDEKYFKQIFIHELGHIVNGSYRPGTYGDRIKSAIKTDGYLTAYSRSAATADDEICGSGDENTRADEDFAESVSYFINQNIAERDYGCGTIDASQNPIYKQFGNGYLNNAHLQLMNELLK